MEESYNDSEESVTMGTPALFSRNEDSQQETQCSVHEQPTDFSFTSHDGNNPTHGMGQLSISSIPAVDSSNPGHLIHSVLSPGSDYQPDILMSTINSKPVSPPPEEDNDDDQSISMGPLPAFSIATEPQIDTSLARQVQKFDGKQKLSTIQPLSMDCKSIQTEDQQCLKCEELHLDYQQKLLEVANEFQKQYASQFKMIDQHAATEEEAQKQIKDLMDQLDGADKQLKVLPIK